MHNNTLKNVGPINVSKVYILWIFQLVFIFAIIYNLRTIKFIMNNERKSSSKPQSRQLSDELMLDEMPGATPPKISRIKDLIIDPPAAVADIVHRYHDHKVTLLENDIGSYLETTNNTKGK